MCPTHTLERVFDGSERDLFNAIVAELDDPEWLHWRRLLWRIGALALMVGAITIAALARLGWLGAGAFALTFVPGLLLVIHIQRVRLNRTLL